MEEKMSRWGTGPVFAALSIGYGIVTIVISRYFHPFFQIEFVPHRFLTIMGIVLIVIGVPFFVVSVFGSEYLRYKQKVPCILPIGFLK